MRPLPVLAFFFFIVLLSCTPESDRKAAGGSSPTPSGPKEPSPDMAEDYRYTNRVVWQKPDVVIDMLGDLSEQVVADIGAGTGFFTVRLARKAKKVIAIDIDQRFIDHLDSVRLYELPEAYQSRMETRLADPDDPNLVQDEADLILIVNTYIYLRDRVEYLRHLREVLPEGGRLLLLDFKKKRTTIGPPNAIRIPLFQAEQEMYEAGFSSVETNDTALDYQYIILATK